MRRSGAEQTPFIEYPLHGSARQTNEDVASDRPVQPEVDGHDRRGGGAIGCFDDRGERRRRVGEDLAPRKPGGRTDDRCRPQHLAADLHASARIEPDPRHGVHSHRPAAAFDERARWPGVEFVQRLQRKTKSRVGAPPAEHASQDCSKRRGGRAIDLLIERRHRERFPEHFDQSWRLPQTQQPLLHRLVRIAGGYHNLPAEAGSHMSAVTSALVASAFRGKTRAGGATIQVRLPPTRVALRRPTKPDITDNSQRGYAVAPAHSIPTDEAGQQMKRRGKPRTLQPGHAACAIDDVEGEIALDENVLRGADATQEPERLVITANQHVLAVVDAFAGSRIGERAGAAAERWARLEDENSRSAGRQCRRRTEPGKAAADDDRVRIAQ
jgi:hypothetical protein